MTLSNTLTKQKSIAQIIPNRLYFGSFDTLPVSNNKIVYLNINESVNYDAFYYDFGPLNLAVLYRFCDALQEILQSKEQRKIFVFTNNNPKNRVNGAFLVASYMVIFHGLSADQAYIRVQAAEPPSFIGYRDASMSIPSYLLHVQHTIKAVEKATQLGWLDFKTFDPDEYEFYERVENGDLNWIVPGKILSFCGPHERSYVDNEYCYHAPEVYFDYFREHNVSTVIRLNRKVYDAKRFTDAGFDHCDLFFIDGSTPSDEITLKFISVVEKARGAVAIHCKAGLGRTGTLIACWMMKNFRLTAAQCMAWLRICRPGSVIGPQQQFLIDKQQWCWKLGQKPAPGVNSLPTPLAGNEIDLTTKKTIINNSPLQPHNIKCKIINNNSNINIKSKILVTRLADELDDFGLEELANDNNDKTDISTDITPNSKKYYSLRSTQKKSNDTSNEKIGVVDETAINEYEQSQGDRLCEMKIKAQHQKNVNHTLIEQIDNLTPNKKSSPITPSIVNDKPKVVSHFSSATTPIKQLKLSSSRKIDPTLSKFLTNCSSISAGYRNMKVSNRIPISKVTVASNCQPSILRTGANKKYLTIRNKPYDYHYDYNIGKLQVEMLCKPKKSINNSGVGFTKNISSSSINTRNNVTGLSSINYTSNLKYSLRPRIYAPTRFDSTTFAFSSRNNPLSALSSSRHVFSTSKSTGRLL